MASVDGQGGAESPEDIDIVTGDERAKPVLEMEGMFKQFGDATALDGVDFAVRRGEVHALLGENGAGKTTLMNIACGILRADGGTIEIDGEPVSIRSPRDGFRHGLGIVHQNYRLIQNFTVAENLHVGWRATPRIVSTGLLQSRTAELAERYGFAVDPRARVYDLSAGEAQRVAILRTLARGARTLVLDEPTALLTPQEAQDLFRVIRALAADGNSVVFVSHKLREVMSIGDRVTVLRRGQRVFSGRKSECTIDMLVGHMVGRGIVTAVRSGAAADRGEPLLALGGVSVPRPSGVPALHDVDLLVRSNEIVGVAGVAGNGQSELAEVATGLRRPASGIVAIAGQDMTGASPREFIRAGVGHMPERTGMGMALHESVETNAVVKALDELMFESIPLLSLRRMRRFASNLLSAAGMAEIGLRRRVSTLSGGQMQRLLVQRELVSGNRVLVVVHPSRGLDVAATERVHEKLIGAAEGGAAVLLISEDLDEVLKLSDRVIVLYEGRVRGEVPRSEADREDLGMLMGGAETVSRTPGGRLSDE